MWKIATIFFITSLIISQVGIEILRSIIHKKREKKNGWASTQDIALYGIIIGSICILGALISGIAWFTIK
jgi:hypothetical protein